MHENQLFLKAEKSSFHQSSIQFLRYNICMEGIEMDKGKVSTVRSWPTPTTINELQRFLGFAHFYSRSIQNYSSTTAERHAQVSVMDTRSRTRHATSEVSAHHFLHPVKPFVVEVDASISGVRAVLSRRQERMSKLLPCTFFSKKLSTAEQSYDICNRELLAIKLTLEEWRHWLEGAKHHFTVLTDHKKIAVSL